MNIERSFEKRREKGKVKTENFEWNGYKATVILPDKPNGKWIWKTEFLYAFDQAEQKLCEMGYTRVYYQVSDMYGSDRAVRLMHEFHKYVVQKYELEMKAILFGFSRGGLYAFNYALYYPEYVSKIYFDAPVLDLKTWPHYGSEEYNQFLKEYHLDEETHRTFQNSPIDNLKEFFDRNIPIFVVAGGSDEVVPFEKNSGALLKFARSHKIEVENIIKPTCGHHPHSLENVEPIVSFVEHK